MNKMGEFLKLLRIKNGYTQKDISDKLHVTPQTISKWELGTSEPNIDMLIQLSVLYQVKIDDLIRGEIIPVRNQIKIEFILIAIIYFLMFVLSVIIPFLDFLVLKFSYTSDLLGWFEFSFPETNIGIIAKLNNPLILSLLIFTPILLGLLLKFDKKGITSFIISIVTSIIFVVYILPTIASPSYMSTLIGFVFYILYILLNILAGVLTSIFKDNSMFKNNDINHANLYAAITMYLLTFIFPFTFFMDSWLNHHYGIEGYYFNLIDYLIHASIPISATFILLFHFNIMKKAVFNFIGIIFCLGYIVASLIFFEIAQTFAGSIILVHSFIYLTIIIINSHFFKLKVNKAK